MQKFYKNNLYYKRKNNNNNNERGENKPVNWIFQKRNKFSNLFISQAIWMHVKSRNIIQIILSKRS